MSRVLTGKNKEMLLHQCRTAAFYQEEYWSALWRLESLLEGPGGCQSCVIERFLQLESTFSGRDLHASDLHLFLVGLASCPAGRKVLERGLTRETQVDLLTQLRKLNWTRVELRRIAAGITRQIGKADPVSILSQFSELASLSDPVTMADVDSFILGM